MADDLMPCPYCSTPTDEFEFCGHEPTYCRRCCASEHNEDDLGAWVGHGWVEAS